MIFKHFKLNIFFLLLSMSIFAKPLDNKIFAPPAEPNYNNKACWAALPNYADNSDLLANKSYINGEAGALVDVFFIYPTIYKKGNNWNADVYNSKLNRQIQNSSIKYQASVFNQSCKIYAPYYRQTLLKAFYIDVKKEPNAQKAFDIAYTDIKNAFEYYLQHYNHGRPIIIASHSQGTKHAKQLLKDFFDNKPLKKQLVNAYLIGYGVKHNEFTTIKPAESAAEIGGFVSYNTFEWGKPVKPYLQGAVATNPLNWTINGEYADKSKNMGAVLRDFKRVRKGLVDAQSHNGILWVHKPNIFGIRLFFKDGNYHVADYNLFYNNIRKNVAERIEAYLKQYPN